MKFKGFTHIVQFAVLFIFIMLFHFIVVGNGGKDMQKEQLKMQYICPPCGCSADHVHYNSPGKCSQCSMDLIEIPSGTKYKIHLFLSNLFQNGKSYAHYYIRIVYPLITFFFLFASFLLINKEKYKRLKWFAVYILCLSLYLLKFQIYGTYYAITLSKVFLFLPLSFLLIIWPSLYFFYIGFFQNKEIRNQEIILHFLPGIISFLFQLALLINYPKSADLLYNQFESHLVPIEQLIFIVIGCFYSWKLRGLVSIKSVFSKKLNFDFLSAFLLLITLIYTIVLAFHLSINFILYDGMVTALDYHLLWFILIVSIPFIIYFVWKVKDVIKDIKVPVYRLTEDFIKKLKYKFENEIVATRVYENEKLSLSEISGLLGISNREMSEFISRGFQSNFYELINSYRVASAKEKLLSDEYRHLTNDAIGNLSGFRSKTTFLKSFKKETGMTPSQYKRQKRKSTFN